MLELEEKIKALPPDLQEKIERIVDDMLTKRVMKPERQFKFDWRGGLEHLKKQYTSVELQHEILNEW